MEEPLEILFVAFCGVVLTFALLFVACWCLISCSFFCIKYFYCANLNKIISVLSLNSEVQSDLDSDDDCSSYCESVLHSHPHQDCEEGRQDQISVRGGHESQLELEGYLVETVSETGSTGKVTPEELPPLYDFPPAYDSLFPTTHRNLNARLKQDFKDQVQVQVDVAMIRNSSSSSSNTSTSTSTSTTNANANQHEFNRNRESPPPAFYDFGPSSSCGSDLKSTSI